MRKWHRWLAILAGVFVLWIAATGLATQFAILAEAQASPGNPVAAIVAPPAQAHDEDEHAAASAPEATRALPPGFVCPEGWRCIPPPPPGAENAPRAWADALRHLHSGETFGPAGTALSILAGLALLFLAVSGLWMYLAMWRQRRARGLRGRWFWR